MKRFFLAIAMVAVLAGCGSSVKLDQPPVEDRAGSSAGAQGAGGSGAGQSGVAPVDLTKSAQGGVGPAGTASVVYFDFDSFVVKPEYQSVVESHARFLRASQARKVMLEGHTDERGGREYNLALGQKRAEAVRRALGLLGVGDAQVEAVSFGEEKPAATGADEGAWAKNRRVEFKYR